MAVIDVGAGATDRSSYKSPNLTYICLNNPADGTGTLDTFEIWVYSVNLDSCKIGTFSGSSTDYTSRDYESIGAVSEGSKQTFTGKNCNVETGDFIGCYFTTGNVEATTSGLLGVYSKIGDQFAAGTQTYNLAAGDALSLYATGATVAAGSLPLKNVFGRPFSGVFR